MKDLIIIGAGGFGREVAALATAINRKEPEWNILGFLDDNKSLKNNLINGYKVLGNLSCVEKYRDAWFICAVGVSSIRKKIIKKLDPYCLNYATLIDPTAIILDAESVFIKAGTIICAGSIMTVNVDIGEHVIINISNTIGHDDKISDFCTINPGCNISGMVTLEECIDVGAGSQILQGKRICSNSVIGAGSVVTKNIDQAGTYVGVPARLIKI